MVARARGGAPSHIPPMGGDEPELLPYILQQREYYMVQLNEQERVVLRDMLDMDIEAFRHAMHAEGEGGFDSWEALLQTTGGHGDTIKVLEGIREKVNDDIAAGGADCSS
jgi:hypothetical protein